MEVLMSEFIRGSSYNVLDILVRWGQGGVAYK